MSEEKKDSWTGCGLKGCLLWGCVSILVIGLIGTGVTIFVVNKAVSTVAAYLDDSPAEFQLPAPSAEAVKAAEEKIAALKMAVADGKAGRFVFSDAEINALINDAIKKKSGSTKFQARVTIAGGEITGEISLPIGEIFPAAAGKYLNGNCVFTVEKSSAGDQLDVRIKSLQARDKPVPENVLKELRKANLVQEIYTNPQNRETREILDKVESVKVDGDRLIIEVAAQPVPPEKAAAPDGHAGDGTLPADTAVQPAAPALPADK